MMDLNDKLVLDACCGPRMFWYDKKNPIAVFMDRREVFQRFGTDDNPRDRNIEPDIIADFRSIPFPDDHFSVVVFDPPHVIGNDNSIMQKVYGSLPIEWQPYLVAGFEECWRVCKPGGVIVFKWSDRSVSASEIVKVFGREPLVWHRYAKKNGTHWMLFLKLPEGFEQKKEDSDGR